MSAPLYVALVHYPIRARDGSLIATAVTSIDVHDIARSSRTFGAKGYFVVTPIAAQRAIVDRILGHWETGEGKTRIPERGEALARTHAVPNLGDAIAAIESSHGERPFVLVTSAQASRETVSFAEQRKALRESSRPHLLVLGTGHGLANSIVASADALLEPIFGVDGYNHLSVRAAAAILLDRLHFERI